MKDLDFFFFLSLNLVIGLCLLNFGFYDNWIIVEDSGIVDIWIRELGVIV